MEYLKPIVQVPTHYVLENALKAECAVKSLGEGIIEYGVEKFIGWLLS